MTIEDPLLGEKYTTLDELLNEIKTGVDEENRPYRTFIRKLESSMPIPNRDSVELCTELAEIRSVSTGGGVGFNENKYLPVKFSITETDWKKINQKNREVDRVFTKVRNGWRKRQV